MADNDFIVMPEK